jgi:hypothetical protein
MRNFKIFVCLADLHIGNKNVSAKDMKKQLKEHFFKEVKNYKYLDGIFILGDILHTIVSLNSDYSEVYLWFIDQVYKLARKKKSTVIIIKGTQSHDNDQLSNIRSYMLNDDNVDFRIYEQIEEITIWDDYKVLVLPDVKIKKYADMDKYFITDKKYDIILGHGIIDTMRYFVQESEHMSSKTYVYPVENLKKACNGPILFGHIHQYQEIRDQFYYVGPFTLLERGGINAGYVTVGMYDNDRSKFKVEQYINPSSARYLDLNINKKIMDECAIDQIVEAIDDIISDTKENDLITLRIIRGDAIDSIDKIAILEARYRKDKRINIVKKIKTKSEEESEQKNKERKDKFAYCMDNNLDMSEIMYRYYESEIMPTLGDKNSLAAKITIDDFKRILKEE